MSRSKAEGIKMGKHTPETCNCFVDDGKTASGTQFNGFCSLHAAAPELLEAVKEAYSMTAPLSTYGRKLGKLIAKAEGHTNG